MIQGIDQDMDRVQLMRNIDVMIRERLLFRRIMVDIHPLKGMVNPRTGNPLMVNLPTDIPHMDNPRMDNRLMDNPRISFFRRRSETRLECNTGMWIFLVNKRI